MFRRIQLLGASNYRLSAPDVLNSGALSQGHSHCPSGSPKVSASHQDPPAAEPAARFLA